MVTSLGRQSVAAFLHSLVTPHAEVGVHDLWQPQGFLDPTEARLGESLHFLTPDHRELITGWWLSIPERSNTPNWDIVSTCRFATGQRGFVLVEAKAHSGELHTAGKDSGNVENDNRIRAAILEANRHFSSGPLNWDLCAERNYQLCNRFAWAWRIAALGTPVMLVYLGFLGATEMGPGALTSGEDWRSHLTAHAQGTVPKEVWETRLQVGDSWVVPVIRAAMVSAQIVTTEDDAQQTRFVRPCGQAASTEP
jgi:hypothetical protein